MLLWKVKREFIRAIAHIRVWFWKRSKSRRHLEYCGFQIPLHRSGMNSGVLMAIARNAYELPEISGVRRVVQQGDRVLELGSGLGVVTAVAARACAPDGLVLSYEPHSDIIPDTKAFLSDHGITNVEIRNSVLVPDPCSETSRDFFLASSFAASSLRASEGRRAQRTVQVPVVPVKQILREFRPDVLVCDIEGAEAELIPALDDVSMRAIVIELHPDRLEQNELDAIFNALRSLGFSETRADLGGTVKLFERDL